LKLGLKRNEIKLVPYSNDWPIEFIRVKMEIQKYTNLEGKRIEHVGSTSIKKMDAKPILDIIVGVDDIDKIDNAMLNSLKKIGFLRLRVERPNEVVFAKFTDDTYEEKTHYIHLVNYESELWHNLIFFRYYLNSDKNARETYKKLKMDYIQNYSNDIKGYTDYKEKFVKEIYSKRNANLNFT
jgi:GrpB-like predicted nucleotidyltransferase (UPF0157 family)